MQDVFITSPRVLVFGTAGIQLCFELVAIPVQVEIIKGMMIIQYELR